VSGPSGTQGKPRTVADSGALLDLSRDAFFARDRDGRITYWNQGAERMYGYGRAEAEGRVARRLGHKIERAFAHLGGAAGFRADDAIAGFVADASD
jgi:PAS domain-containing protein